MQTRFESTENARAAKRWVLVDADGQTVGRVASKIASILRGKENPKFSPHTDCGDYVVVINAEKVRFTGNKWEEKPYRSYSGYIGGVKEKIAGEVLAATPERILEHAVQGMLPKTSLGRKQLKNMKIYAGTEHPHKAQNPTQVQLAAAGA